MLSLFCFLHVNGLCPESVRVYNQHTQTHAHAHAHTHKLCIYKSMLFVLGVRRKCKSRFSAFVTLCCDLFSNFHIKNNGRLQRITRIRTPTLYPENKPQKWWKSQNTCCNIYTIAIFTESKYHNMLSYCIMVSLPIPYHSLYTGISSLHSTSVYKEGLHVHQPSELVDHKAHQSTLFHVFIFGNRQLGFPWPM